MDKTLIELAERLEEVGDIPDDDVMFAELGDMFYSYGSDEVITIAHELRELAKEVAKK